MTPSRPQLSTRENTRQTLKLVQTSCLEHGRNPERVSTQHASQSTQDASLVTQNAPQLLSAPQSHSASVPLRSGWRSRAAGLCVSARQRSSIGLGTRRERLEQCQRTAPPTSDIRTAAVYTNNHSAPNTSNLTSNLQLPNQHSPFQTTDQSFPSTQPVESVRRTDCAITAKNEQRRRNGG